MNPILRFAVIHGSFLSVAALPFTVCAQATQTFTASDQLPRVSFVGELPDASATADLGDGEQRLELSIRVNRRGQVESVNPIGGKSPWAIAATKAVADWVVAPSVSADCSLVPYETRIMITANARSGATVATYAAGAFMPKQRHGRPQPVSEATRDKALVDISRNPNWVTVAALLTIENASGNTKGVEIRDMALHRGFARKSERDIYGGHATLLMSAFQFSPNKLEGVRQECVTGTVIAGAAIHKMERTAAPERR